MRDAEKKREKEQAVVTEMIRIYCRSKHTGKELCPSCAELAEYARMRSAKCPFMENKTFCSNCAVHCYRPEMRQRIKEVMRFSGPRMLFYHPGMVIYHVIASIMEKKGKQEKER